MKIKLDENIPNTHHGLLLVRLRSPGRVALTLKIRDIFKNEAVTDWRECFVVVTESSEFAALINKRMVQKRNGFALDRDTLCPSRVLRV